MPLPLNLMVFVGIIIVVAIVGTILASLWMRQRLIKFHPLNNALYLLVIFTGLFIGIELFVSIEGELFGLKVTVSAGENEEYDFKITVLLLATIIFLSLVIAGRDLLMKYVEKQELNVEANASEIVKEQTPN